jgi:hypothetical protein
MRVNFMDLTLQRRGQYSSFVFLWYLVEFLVCMSAIRPEIVVVFLSPSIHQQ